MSARYTNKTRNPAAVVLLGLAFSLALSCAPADPRPDPEQDYKAYIGWVSRQMCNRIHSCYGSLTRALSPAMRKTVTVENCSKAALKGLDEKLKLHTPSMKANSVQCYETLLEAGCFDFGALVYWDPSCMILRKETDEVYKKASAARIAAGEAIE